MIPLMFALASFSFDARPPAEHINDSELVEVSLGEMRRALWYYHSYHDLLSFAKTLSENHEMILSDYQELEQYSNEITGIAENLSRQRTVLIAATLALSAALLTAVIIR